MRLLVLNWGAYTHPDIIDIFKRNALSFRELHYCFGNKYEDEFFSYYFLKYLKEEHYDAVFTVNFYPIISELCHSMNLPYLSWSYDNPLDIPDAEKYFQYETNYVFLFDRISVQEYLKKGAIHVYHLPLAINTERLSRITLSTQEKEKYSSEISFIGTLYQSSYDRLISSFTPYQKGYLNALCRAQSKVYGYYFIEELLTDQLLDELSQSCRAQGAVSDFTLNRRFVSYTLGCHITREERISLLAMLSRRFHTTLYSREEHPLLSQTDYRGSISYLQDMPKMFRASKINLNINLRVSQSGMPLRVLDTMGAGGFLLSSYQPELAEYFIPGEECVLYQSIGDALEQCEFYLENENLRTEIATKGCAKTRKEFSYEKQFQKLFQTANLDF